MKGTQNMALIINENNYEQEVVNSDIPVLVDFFATWCGPCKMLAPIIEELAQEYEGKVKICKVDVDNDPELAMKFDVASIPTLVLLKNGELVNKHVGFLPKASVEKMFE